MKPLLLWAVLLLTPLQPTRYDPMARGFLGIRVLDGQLTIDSIEPDSPASRAGLKPGDLFLIVEGQPVQSYADVTQRIRSHRPGRSFTGRVRRGQDTIDFRAVLIPRPSSADRP